MWVTAFSQHILHLQGIFSGIVSYHYSPACRVLGMLPMANLVVLSWSIISHHLVQHFFVQLSLTFLLSFTKTCMYLSCQNENYGKYGLQPIIITTKDRSSYRHSSYPAYLIPAYSASAGPTCRYLFTTSTKKSISAMLFRPAIPLLSFIY
jgi:hypothetical protein